MPKHEDSLAAAVAKHGIGAYRRHVLLCLGPKCCPDKEGEAAWDALKKALKDAGDIATFRTKVGCLRVCEQGPILVVYPEGTWYCGMTAGRAPRFARAALRARAPRRGPSDRGVGLRPQPAAGR